MRGASSTVPPPNVPWINLQRWLRGRFYRWRGTRFRAAEALLWSTALDTWHRYAAIREALEQRVTAGTTVLELGPGWAGLEFFLAPEFRSRSLAQADIVRLPLLPLEEGETRFLASGSALPFREEAFDFVIAVDVMEHVPREVRPAFSAELQRVARTGVLLHVPLDDGGTYLAGLGDRSFLTWYQARFGHTEPNIEEHLAAGHPDPGEMARYFPGASIVPTQSMEDWLWYMKGERVAMQAPFLGLIQSVRKSLPGPPFYSALVVWDKG